MSDEPHPWGLRPGDALGAYRLERRIGVGGMAEVWRARRGREVFAVKVLHGPLAADEEFRVMFRDEMDLVASLRHPHVVRLIEAVDTEEVQAQVMEWIDGVDLSALEVHLERDGGCFPVAAAVQIVRGAARALETAHALVGSDGRPRQLVHRDVAPQNIMVGREGDVKLLDFGVAKATARLTQTAAGVIKGRLGYMAPEQALGLELSGRADVFALGVVFWELLAMERLFPAGGSLAQVVHRPPPARIDLRRPAVGRDLAELLARMLAPDPRVRASMRDVAEGLEGFAEPGFDFAAWCRAVLPPPRESTAVLPASGAPPDARTQPDAGRPAEEDTNPWSSGERTVYDAPEGAPTDETPAAGEVASGPTVAVSPGDDATWAAPLDHARRIRGETAADAAWVRAPIGAARPQAFARTASVARTEELVLPSDLTPPWASDPGAAGPSEPAWESIAPTRAVPEPPPPPRPWRRPSRTEVVLLGVVAVQAGLLAWGWWGR